MISASRLAIVAAAGLSVAACSQLPKPSIPLLKKDAGQASAPKTPDAPALAGPKVTDLKPGQWAQELSDVAPDPAWRFGVLPNGMRYALRKNATPPGQAALRLWIDAGSMMEADDQQGLAHFLEHMAFNGSKNVPEGEMIKILERHGLAFGADTNASTSFDETIYQLDLPKTDDDTVDTSLMLLREAAGELTIAPEAVDRERGVVLSEERTRDTPGYRVAIKTLSAQMEGQLPPKRIPIGKTEVLKTAPAQRIRDFYEAYYRPERTVLVAVGDFDVDAMEAKIKGKFGDWVGKGPNGKDPDVGPVAKRGPTAKMFVEAGAPWSIQMTWTRKPEGLLETKAVDERDTLENLGFAVLNRRLQAVGRSAEPPFIAGGAFKGDQFGAVRVTTFGATAQPGRWREALTALDAEQRRAIQYGVRQDELDREIASLRAGLVAAAAGEATQRTPSLANQLVGTLGDGEVVTSPSQNLAAFDLFVKGLTAERVNAVLKSAFVGSGPLLVLAAPTAVEGGEPAILKAYEELKAQPVAPPIAPGVTVWPYSSFGPTGKVAEQKEVSDLDAVLVRFDNGVRLTVKPTKFRDDQVIVKVRAGHGLLDMPSDKQSPLWSGSAFIEGGLKQITAQDMERVLTGKIDLERPAGRRGRRLHPERPHPARGPVDRTAGSGGLRHRTGLASRGVQPHQDQLRHAARSAAKHHGWRAGPRSWRPDAWRRPALDLPVARTDRLGLAGRPEGRRRQSVGQGRPGGGDRRRHDGGQGDRCGRRHLRRPARAAGRSAAARRRKGPLPRPVERAGDPHPQGASRSGGPVHDLADRRPVLEPATLAGRLGAGSGHATAPDRRTAREAGRDLLAQRHGDRQRGLRRLGLSGRQPGGPPGEA